MKPAERIAELQKLSKVYAKAKSEMDYLKHFRKSQLAILKAEYSKANSKWSNVKCEDAARGCQRYLTVLDGLKIATEIAESALWELKNSHAGIQIYQTQRADRRAEIKHLNREQT